MRVGLTRGEVIRILERVPIQHGQKVVLNGKKGLPFQVEQGK